MEPVDVAGLRPADAESRTHGRPVIPGNVITVAAEVFGGDLPVTRDDPFVRAGKDLDTPVAPIEDRIQIPRHLPEILAQGRGGIIERSKNQPLVAVDLSNRAQRPALSVEPGSISGLLTRHTFQLAIICVRPPVVCTGQRSCVADIRPAEAIAAMTANIEKRPYFACGIAPHDDRIFRDVGGAEIARPRNLF